MKFATSLLFLALSGTTLAQSSEPTSAPASTPTSAPTPALLPTPAAKETEQQERTRSGAFSTISTGALYGLLTGINLDVNVGFESPEALLGVPLLTGITGGALGYGYKKLHKKGFSDAEGTTISAAATLGFVESIIISREIEAEIGNGDGLQRMWLGTTGGLLLGVGAVELLHPKRGDATMVTAGALWGSITAAEIFAISQGNLDNFSTALLIGYNTGIAVGIGTAIATDIKPYRVGIANGAGLLGLLGGSLLGGLGALFANAEQPGKIIAAGALLGQSAGFAAGIVLTK